MCAEHCKSNSNDPTREQHGAGEGEDHVTECSRSLGESLTFSGPWFLPLNVHSISQTSLQVFKTVYLLPSRSLRALTEINQRRGAMTRGRSGRAGGRSH